ncbi:hypothetical protein SLEP1_g55423 [Rubroshorea leprosula]|uniref:Disease resistance protein n=1 Tax=Rubroshorea leprosula TaxID=152421 RepID=A0AAV5MFG6_9ROSI|nr:hypothetical protein SLEP1_g55423 [Rubroshorea leprosula]
MADVVGPLLEIVNCFATPTCNYVNHYKNFDEDVNKLRAKLEDLNRRKSDIESTIQAEARAGEMVKEEVQGWIQRAQTINDEVQAILDKAQRVKWYRKACLGKHVRRKFDEVKEIHEQGSFTGGLVIARPPAPGSIIPTENLEGEISTKERIWEYLMGDEVRTIGVCGIGGVGKTTIMKHVNNDLLRENRFQKVIWVTVSYPFNVFEVQKKIADAMDVKLREDEEQMRRVAKLMEIMGRVRFVLILDDVWDNFSFNDVGIPEPTPQNGCKVVITSRSAQVGHDVLQVAGLEEILKLIVEECAGLPLAIVVIAGGMKGEGEPNIVEWRNALNDLRQRVKSVNDMEEKIFGREELIEGWIDEGLIHESEKRQDAYDRADVFLNRLEKNCLLEKTVNRAVNIFKMHDVVRDMAIKSIGSGVGYMVKAGRKLTEVPNEQEWWAIDLNKVSLMANYISEIPISLTPKCPTLSTLILSDNPLTKIPESLFEDMTGLKVLDLSRTNIEALPSSMSKLEYLSALRLRGCERLKCLPSLEKIVELKKLDLRWAAIEVVPQGMEMLVSLEYLDLFCKDLKEIPTGILSKLSSLQYLVAKGDWGRTSLKINLEEVARLSKLEILECNFDDMQDFNYLLSEFKNFQSFIAYKLLVGTKMNYTIDIDEPKYKCRLTISGCDIGEERIVLPDNLQLLQIHNCKNMRSSLNKTALLENASELGLCIISDCEEIEYVVNLDSSSSSSCSSLLNKLEDLYLWDLPRLWVLMRVEGVATPPCFFSNLKTLEIDGCSGMKQFLALELLQALQNLEVIWVIGCEQMEEIIASANLNASSSDKFTFTFPKLRDFHLSNLPQLKSICSANGIMVCDSIERIWITKCPELKRIPVQLPLLNNGQPSPPPHLSNITIDRRSKEWWESVVEWDYPNAKNILQPFLELVDY